MPFCIGFTGTEFDNGMTPAQLNEVQLLLEEELAKHGSLIARHGDCIGADAQFHAVCLTLNIPVVVHPPLAARKRAYCQGAERVLPPKEYLERNHDIARLCNLLIAAPRENSEIPRSGTWATVRSARKHKKPVAIVYRSGDVDLEVEA